MLILVCIYSHSLQVIETCRTCTFYFAKKKKTSTVISCQSTNVGYLSALYNSFLQAALENPLKAA